MSPYILWLAFGVVCFVIEALVVSGVGFLFAGLGALTVGSIITAYPEIIPLQQGVLFLGTTALWAAFLWKPLQKFLGKSSGKGYQNLIGDTCYIGGAGLQKGMVGEATWSGTIMRAQLADGIDILLPGAAATITGITGNTLIVKPQ